MCRTLEQVTPPPDEYAIETWKQIKRVVQTLPPREEHTIQVREKIYLSPSTQQLLSQLVLCIDQANAEYVEREDRCHKFINQDLQFISQSKQDTKVTSKPIKLPQRSYQYQLDQPTQTVEPVVGFTPEEYKEAQDDPEINVEDLLQIEPCTDYVKTPLQTTNELHINKLKRFLLLLKEALKIAEAVQKEQQAAQGLASHLKS